MKKETPEEKSFVQSTEPVKEKSFVKKETSVVIMFRQNRKFDLHIGREMITFRGRESKKVPKTWINHKDFEVVKKYFIIKEGV